MKRITRSIIAMAVPFVSIQKFANCEASTGSGKPEAFDCKQAACASKLDMFRRSMDALSGNSKNESNAKSRPKLDTMHPKEASVESNSEEASGIVDCPIDRQELGSSTWKLIHTLAANYPESPTEKEKEMAIRFMESLSLLYPCHICAKDFQLSMKEHPPRVSTRKEFVLWCCELHNEVNAKLGYKTVPCDLSRLDEKWREGRKGCWNWREENEESVSD